MKVFLNGGLGFIGRRFIKKFSNQHDIIVCALNKDILAFQGESFLKNIIIEEGTTEGKEILEVMAKHKPDVVIHLAALTGLKKCHEDPELAFKINVHGTFNVLTACAKHCSKFIFISSREVFGETINDKSKEDDPLLPNNVYGITKMIGENLVKFFNEKYSLDFTILRLTNVYGPEGDQYGAQVIIKNAIKEKKITILGGKQRLNYVYADDVIDIINQVLDDEQSSKQIFNVGSNDTLSIDEFSQKVLQLFDDKLEVEHMPMRDTETVDFEPSLEKIYKLLNYSPKTSILEGLQKTIEWYKQKI